MKRVYQLFRIFYAASRDKFLVSRISNCLAVEAVIMHETKRFSHAIRDKISVQENNRIVKRLLIIFTLSRACPFFLSCLACFSHLADVLRIVCNQLYTLVLLSCCLNKSVNHAFANPATVAEHFTNPDEKINISLCDFSELRPEKDLLLRRSQIFFNFEFLN